LVVYVVLSGVYKKEKLSIGYADASFLKAVVVYRGR